MRYRKNHNSSFIRICTHQTKSWFFLFSIFVLRCGVSHNRERNQKGRHKYDTRYKFKHLFWDPVLYVSKQIRLPEQTAATWLGSWIMYKQPYQKTEWTEKYARIHLNQANHVMDNISRNAVGSRCADTRLKRSNHTCRATNWELCHVVLPGLKFSSRAETRILPRTLMLTE